MTSIHSPLGDTELPISRVMGEFSQSHPGPLLVILAGVHGNEPSGVIALRRVLDRLQQSEWHFAGHLCGIACNLPALAEGVRYIDEDLNRIWLTDRVEALRGGRPPETSEENELAEIMEVIDNRRRAAGDNYFVDLHTTSSATLPYISVPRCAESVEFAGDFGIFTVLGTGDAIDGTSDRYLIDQGFTGFTYEAGRHGDLASIENQEAIIWRALKQAGCLPDIPPGHAELLAKNVLGADRYFTVEYIHHIAPDSGFRMKPGFFNFQRVSEGEVLGWENEVPICSRWDAHVFLPLYQPLGDEGFTIVRPLAGPGDQAAGLRPRKTAAELGEQRT